MHQTWLRLRSLRLCWESLQRSEFTRPLVGLTLLVREEKEAKTEKRKKRKLERQKGKQRKKKGDGAVREGRPPAQIFGYATVLTPHTNDLFRGVFRLRKFAQLGIIAAARLSPACCCKSCKSVTPRGGVFSANVWNMASCVLHDTEKGGEKNKARDCMLSASAYQTVLARVSLHRQKLSLVRCLSQRLANYLLH